MAYHTSVEEKDNPLINNENQIPVPVIATFNKDGKFYPIYFSIEGIRIKVDRIKWVSDKNVWGYTFRCEITLADRVETVDLYYYKNLNIWALKKKDNR